MSTASALLFSHRCPHTKIIVEQKRLALDGGEVSLVSKFNLVDLAGERYPDAYQEDTIESVFMESVYIVVCIFSISFFPMHQPVSSLQSVPHCLALQGRRNGIP